LFKESLLCGIEEKIDLKESFSAILWRRGLLSWRICAEES